MSGGPEIWLAGEEDIPAIRAMLAALAEVLGYGTAFASTEAALRRHGFGPEPQFEVMMAGPREAPLGMALFFRHFSTMRGKPGAYVQDLYVDGAARGQGLGERLLAAVAGYGAEKWGAAYLMLTVHDLNEGAGRFYARLGFDAHGDETVMALDGPKFTRVRDGKGKP